jgi:hypothetical protein
MLHLAQCVVSRRHFLGSKKCLAECLYEEGLLLFDKKQFSLAAKSWGQAAILQHPASHGALSSMLTYGVKGVAEDAKRAFELASAGAALGCAHSQGVLSCCLVHGLGVAQDVDKGLAVIIERLNAAILQHEFDVIEILVEMLAKSFQSIGFFVMLQRPAVHVHQLFSTLISNIVQRIQWPANCDTWSRGCVEQTTFSLFRDEDIATVLAHATVVLKGDGAMGVIWPTLVHVLATPAAYPWRQVEAYLFVGTCLIGYIESKWEPFMLSVLQNVHAIAAMHPKCVHTLLSLFQTDGALNRLNKPEHAAHAPEWISTIFSFIQNTLTASPQQLHDHCVQALHKLALHCPTHLASHIDLLAAQASSNCPQSLMFTSSSVREHFMNAVSVIAATLPVKNAVQVLDGIVLTAVADLQTLLSEHGQLDDNSEKVRGRQQYVESSQRLTSLYKAMELQVSNHASKISFQGQIFESTRALLWPVLRDVLWLCARDDYVSEEVIKTLKHWLRSCGVAAAPILPELCQHLSQVTCL